MKDYNVFYKNGKVLEVSAYSIDQEGNNYYCVGDAGPVGVGSTNYVIHGKYIDSIIEIDKIDEIEVDVYGYLLSYNGELNSDKNKVEAIVYDYMVFKYPDVSNIVRDYILNNVILEFMEV